MIKKSLSIALFMLITTYCSAQIQFKETHFFNIGNQTSIDVVEVGDVNNDGLSDVVFGSGFYFDDENDYNFFIYEQNSNGTLKSPKKVKYPDAYPGLNTLQLGDVNNDSLTDIIFDFDNNIGMIYQLPNGGFSQVKSYYMGHQINGLEICELNNDSLKDIVSLFYQEIFVLYQMPDNSYVRDTIFLGDDITANDLMSKDVNNDGLNDLITWGTYQYPINIIYQDSVRAFQDPVIKTIDYQFEYFKTFDAADVADINGDGYADIVGGIGGNTAAIVIFYQDSSGNFDTTLQLTSYDCPSNVKIIDLNCDGISEIVTGSDCGNYVNVYEQDTLFGGFFHYKQYAITGNAGKYGLAFGDINNDNKIDMATIGYQGGNILYNDSKPSYFSLIDTVVNSYQSTKDTIVNYDYQTSELDTSNGCNREFLYTYTVNETYKQTRKFGDTTFIRHGTMCDLPYIDTLLLTFDSTINTLLSSDTSRILDNIDTLVYNYDYHSTIQVIDTLKLWSENRIDTLKLEDIRIISDTIVITVDSIKVNETLLNFEIRTSNFNIFRGYRCNDYFYDTLYSYENINYEQTILVSDTTFISQHTDKFIITSNKIHELDNQEVYIYPNPVSNHLTINYKSSDCSKSIIKIYNIIGEVVFEKEYIEPQETKIDVTDIQTGIYLMELIFNDSKRYLKKIVINKNL